MGGFTDLVIRRRRLVALLWLLALLLGGFASSVLFWELPPDLTWVLGPDHPRTVIRRWATALEDVSRTSELAGLTYAEADPGQS